MSRSDKKNRDGREVPSEQTPLIPPNLRPVDPDPETAVGAEVYGTPNGHPKPDSTSTDDETTHSISLVRGILCTCALGFLIFLQATNISLLTTTQSAIASELDAFERVTWFTSAYLIAMSSLAPLNGKLASIFSPRICIFTSTCVLASGCVLSSLANSFEVFIAGRCLTGVGASGILTISIIIVLELTGPERRGIAIGLLNAGFTVGVAVGATAAGAMLPVTGWRAVFWVQAPIALVGGTTLLVVFPHDFHPAKKQDAEYTTMHRLSRMDYFGALTLTSSIVLFLYALSSPKKIPLLPIGLSVIVLITFLLNEIYLAHDPIIPITLLKSRGLLLTCLGTVGYMMSRWCVLFYAPTYAIAVRQWSPASAGSILIPTNGGFAIGGLVVGWFHIKRPGSFYLPTVITYMLFPITLVILAFISTEDSPAWLYVVAVFACGAVTGAALNYTLAHILHMTPKSTHYVATSLLATFRGFAGSFGSAIGGGLFQRSLYGSLEDRFRDAGMQHQEDLIRRLLGSPALVENLDGVKQEIAIKGYQDALRTLFLAAAGMAFLTVFVQAGVGWKAAALEGDEDERRPLADGQDENRS